MRPISSFLRQAKRRKIQHRRATAVLSVLSVIVALSVFWQLRLDGITLSDDVTCGVEAHTHGSECYTAKGAEGLHCPVSVHTHLPECYDESQNLTCGQADFVVHTHDARCVDGEGYLVCGLSEVKEHRHEDACCQQTEIQLDPGHTHADTCFDWVTPETPACGLEESETHTHDDTCFPLTRGEQICTEEEREPTMGLSEPELICDKQEVILHTHGDGCYSLNEETQEQILICTQTVVEAHQHTDDCFRSGEPVLACTLEEGEEHTHDAKCYEAWELTCQLPEHSHTLGCTADTAAGVETPEIWEAPIAAVEKSGIWTEDLLSVAVTQLGYQSVEKNFILLEDGSTIRNYTRYGAWMGEPYAPWNTPFLAFCLNYADVPQDIFPWEADAARWIEALTAAGYYHAAGETTPEAADILFFDRDGDAVADHAALLERLETDEEGLLTLHVLEGGDAQGVIRNTYPAENLLGYADLSAAYDFWQLRQQEQQPEDPLVHTAEIFTDGTYTIPRADETIVTVHGQLPEGAVVKAYPVDLAMDDITVLCAYDISIFLPDGTLYEPEQPLTVQIQSAFPEDNLAVYHMLPDGAVETVDHTAQDDGITFDAPGFSVYAVVDTSALEGIAEPGDPEAAQALVDSGFFTYWQQYLEDPTEEYTAWSAADLYAAQASVSPYAVETSSTEQIVSVGGEVTAENGGVRISKTISGTDTENVFDILLEVSTNTSIEELTREPDMAVVIVMDISNTMNSAFGGTTRYAAAVAAAEDFMDAFAGVAGSISRVGYVAFNTDAHEIFPLSECSTEAQVTALKNTMRTKTGNIINNYEYNSAGDIIDRKRYTNIEAGLKMGYDMLAASGNENKYIIFLSDGFPTTYIKSGYVGWNTHMEDITSSKRGEPGTDGVFYDEVNDYYCLYGTSYSDKAAIRAREMATAIKKTGAKIFSIGIDVGTQTIVRYDGRVGLSVIDRTSETYEIGSADAADAFKNWLGNGIGSGYYYDSTNAAGLKEAYDKIFTEIKYFNQQTSYEKWVANDPMPMTSEAGEQTVEFLGFYEHQGQGDYRPYPPHDSLAGTNVEGGENTASYDAVNHAIRWDLKSSGYYGAGTESNYYYNYYLRYRVRLKNERDTFVETHDYNTNGETTLRYQQVTTVDGVQNLGEVETLLFPYPQVRGYLGDLSFDKVDMNGAAVAGAEFTLTHDTSLCSLCRGDGLTYVELNTWTATSDADGKVSFLEVPSGHIYTLEETVTPPGYYESDDIFRVEIAYDKVTVSKTLEDGSESIWTIGDPDNPFKVINNFSYVLPATGGAGILPYLFGGLLLMAAPLKYETSRRKRGRRGSGNK